MVTPVGIRILLAVVGAATLVRAAGAAEWPPRNPFLADSSYPIGHGGSAQQDALRVRGPDDPGAALDPGEIQYAPVGPAHFGAYTSSPYPDGRRVIWSNGLDRIVKVDFETFEVLATYWVPGAKRWTEADADASIARPDASNEGFFAIWNAFRDVSKLRDLSSVYTVLDADNTYFIADKNGSVAAYADEDPADPRSPIVQKAVFRFPAEVTGLTVGMNMTFDGWLIVPTEHGYVVAISRDLKHHRVIRLRYSEGAEEKATRPTGYGWVRNGVAIDASGGLYIASQEHMHKVVWRDAIPENWLALAGAPDRRIAGMQPADMGDPDLTEIQSEQSVVVAGYGALVVNNVGRNAPWYLPSRAAMLLISFLGSAPRYQPFGVQKFEWDPATRVLREAWVNRTVSSPSGVPIVSYPSDRVYLIGARDNRFTLEALAWRNGRSAFHTVIGGQRYNPLFSGTEIDEAGRIHYGSPWGRVRLAPRTNAAGSADRASPSPRRVRDG